MTTADGGNQVLSAERIPQSVHRIASFKSSPGVNLERAGAGFAPYLPPSPATITKYQSL